MEGIDNRVVSELLSEDDYEEWCIQVETYLEGRDLWDVVEADEPAHENETQAKAWKQKNALALHAIHMSCKFRKSFSAIKGIRSAKAAWAALADKYGLKPEEHNGENQSEKKSPEFEIKEESNSSPKKNGEAESESDFSARRENLVNPNEEEQSEQKEVEEKANSVNNEEAASGSRISPGRENLVNTNKEEEKEQKEIKEKSNSAKNEEVASGSRINPAAGSDQNLITETNKGVGFQQCESLFKSVACGDWDKARLFLDQHPEAVRVRDPNNLGKNALHVAVAEGRLNVVEELGKRMTDEDVEMTISDGLTVLAVAIEIKKMAIVKCLIRKNKKLLSIPHCYYGLPVQQAVFSGQTQMARYLYSVTQLKDLDGRSGSDFLTHCIFAKQFDIAFHLTERLPHLAITKSFYQSPVYVLSLVEVSGCSLNFWKQWIYNCIRVPDFGTNHILLDIQNLTETSSDEKDLTFFRRYTKILSTLMTRTGSNLLRVLGIKKMYEIKLVHVQFSELLKQMCKVIKTTSDEQRLKEAGVLVAIVEAAKKGNTEFITGILEAKPQFLNDRISRIVVNFAIEHRRTETFKLVYGLQRKVDRQLDQLTSTSLQQAAKIAPSRLLNRTAGAALQMQRELQWFKEVERIASPLEQESIIQRDSNPRDIFTESHKELVIAGEKWMKETSSSCTVVGALIITVTFAAAFTFPGGNDQNSGFPMFMNMKLFRVFTLSNAIALISSTTSVLMFLGILTSRYAEEDFLKSLPTKLIIGLSTLLFSIAAMIVAFCVGLAIMFQQQSWIVVPSVSLASIPVALFVWMLFPLLSDMIMSTYGPSIY